MNVIIIAALALIVLVVLVFIFSGKITVFGQGTENCVNLGGKCTSQGYTSNCIETGTCECRNPNEKYIQGTNCEKIPNTPRICCKEIY